MHAARRFAIMKPTVGEAESVGRGGTTPPTAVQRAFYFADIKYMPLDAPLYSYPSFLFCLAFFIF